MHSIVPYNPDDSTSTFEDYYDGQIGHGLSVYVGKPYMSGNGIGSVFSGLVRSALPLLKKGAVKVGKNLLREGVGVIGDVASGKNFKQSAKSRLKSVGKSLLGDVEHAITSPTTSSTQVLVNPSRKRKRVGGGKKKNKSKRKRTIFD